jgi:hypothetical protein
VAGDIEGSGGFARIDDPRRDAVDVALTGSQGGDVNERDLGEIWPWH